MNKLRKWQDEKRKNTAAHRKVVKEYDTEKDFKPGCACPESSIGIIAARPAL